MLKCVMFDWDGTLSDQSVLDEIAKKAVLPFWRKLGFRGDLEEFKRLDGKTNDKMRKMWREKKKFRVEDWSVLFAKNAGLKISKEVAGQEFELFFDYYIKCSKLYPSVREILKFIKERGLSLALVSDNWMRAYGAFERCGVTDYFDAIAVSEEVNCLKFHLGPFRFVLERLGLNPGECLMVGDSLIDDGACKRLGIMFCLVDREKKHDKDVNRFDFRIENLEELNEIIQKLSSKRR